MIPSDVFVAITLLCLWGIVILVRAAPIGFDPKCTECKDRKRRAKEAEAERVERSRIRQVELAHDVEHKGWGFKSGAPDVLSCSRETCPRNKRP